ncbi:hypothetical protein Tco_0912790 [Tanacetum coccineum]
MAEIGCNWARIGPSKSSQSLSIAHKWAAVIERLDVQIQPNNEIEAWEITDPVWFICFVSSDFLYELQLGALYLMGAIYLTDECVKKDIAPALSFKDWLLFPRYLNMVIELEGHSKPKELLVFESYIVEAEEGSANVLHGSSHCDSRGCSSSTDNTIHEVQKQVVTVCVNKSFEAIWTTCSEGN